MAAYLDAWVAIRGWYPPRLLIFGLAGTVIAHQE